jgi:hypothetical protein
MAFLPKPAASAAGTGREGRSPVVSGYLEPLDLSLLSASIDGLVADVIRR